MFRQGNKPLLITGVVVLLAILLAVVSHYGNGIPKRIASNVIMPVEKAVAWTVRPVAVFFDNVTDAGALRAENEKLKEEINELKIQNRSVEEYIKENERLKDLLALRDNMEEKEVISASVVSADSSGFVKTIVINRGDKDGISEGDAVLSNNGVIGRISETGAHWSEVTTILSPSHSLGVKVARTGDIAVAEGDVSLVRENLLRLDYIPTDAQIIEGDIITTSGVGGIYPPGLTVGKVKNIKKDNSGKTDYAVIEPTQNLKRIYDVIVITDWKREQEAPVYVDSDDAQEVEVTDEFSSDEIENAQG